MRSLYVHVPFCPTICPYCDFHVVRRHAGIVEAYLDRLEAEANKLFERYPGPLDTLYFGGGTPSFLRSHELSRLKLPWDIAGAEVSMEANPGTLNKSRLEQLKDLGVNRLSVGVQSFQDPVLKTLGRAHGRRGALQAVELSLEMGFRTSVDLILGLPEQDIEADLLEVVQLGLGHVSAYTLQIEPGTPFYHSLEPDSDREAGAFVMAEDILGGAGLHRYEVSNFAKPGQESQHNLVYWRQGFWGALGPGATSYWPGYRQTNPPLPRWLQGEAPSQEPVSPAEHLKESIMMGLRLQEGWLVPPVDLKDPLEALVKEELVVLQSSLEGPRVVATIRGREVLHGVILRLWEALE
jgi:putative oxygen-independent coproporphyrinogen III oxidase